MKILENIRKNYNIFNITILGLCIYVIFFPLISEMLEYLFPGITKCPYLTITGKPCPLCGGTRFFKSLSNSLTLNNLFFVVILNILIFEIIFRTVNIIKKRYSRAKIEFDIALHIFFFLGYIFYEIWFIM